MEQKSNTQMPTTGIKDLVNQVPDLAMEIPEGLSLRKKNIPYRSSDGNP